MGAFNWITIDATCPVCTWPTSIRCQTHVASTYDGDATGRFHERAYRLGERMAWWPPADPRHDDWRDAPSAIPRDGSSIDEACYADCTACGDALCVVIRFRDLVPAETCAISPEADWPDGHPS